MEKLWIFGYGSLMWRPGFDFVEVQKAKLFGLHRRLCIYSHVHRGTPDRPGLVLGLDKGGSCEGLAFKVADEKQDEVVEYLREREQINGVYVEGQRKLQLEDGQQVKALCFSALTSHKQYAPKLSHEDMLNVIKGAVGQAGPNEDYVISTAKKIAELGTRDLPLERLCSALEGKSHS